MKFIQIKNPEIKNKIYSQLKKLKKERKKVKKKKATIRMWRKNMFYLLIESISRGDIFQTLAGAVCFLKLITNLKVDFKLSRDEFSFKINLKF